MIAHAAIMNMSAPCKAALGQKWNLFNGLTSLAGKADLANPDAVKFYDGRTDDVGRTHMSDWGWSSNASSTVKEIFANNPDVYGFTSEYQGRASNDIVFGDYFFQHSEIQWAGMLHEMLHAYTGLEDIDLAAKLGLGNFDSVIKASGQITEYLSKGCTSGMI